MASRSGYGWRLVTKAVTRIHELENEIGCFFDRNIDGTLHQKPFAGQTFDRTAHKGDLTGIEIISRLMEQVLSRSVEKLQEHRAIGLIPSRDGSALAGVLFIDMRRGTFRLVRAKTVLMATGGGPTMYKYHTPSGDKSMDGLSMALRRGLVLRDMEMVQFHPTGLMAGDETKMTGTVLEGGFEGLVDILSMARINDLCLIMMRRVNAPHAILSAAPFTRKCGRGRTSPYGGVYISMAHLGPDIVKQKFQGMVKRCADSGFDLAAGLVEVVPTAHYLMGGVVVDVDTRTSLQGLYVAGEDAGGAHGSNRLGGNGVANSTVYGGIAGDVMGADALKMGALHDPDETVLEEELTRALIPFSARPGNVQEFRTRLMNIMWDDVGVMRDAASIRRGIEKIAALKDEMETVGVAADNLAFNLSWHDWLNLQSLIDTSEVIAKAGLSRENSRGAHFREDFPDAGPFEQSYFTVAKSGDNGIEVSREAVKFTIVKPGESLLGVNEAKTLVGAVQ